MALETAKSLVPSHSPLVSPFMGHKARGGGESGTFTYMMHSKQYIKKLCIYDKLQKRATNAKHNS